MCEFAAWWGLIGVKLTPLCCSRSNLCMAFVCKTLNFKAVFLQGPLNAPFELEQPFGQRNFPNMVPLSLAQHFMQSLIEVPLWRFLLCVYLTFLTSSALPPPLQPPAKYLLPEMIISDYGKKCVVIDLDETLVHSSFKVNAEEKLSFVHLN